MKYIKFAVLTALCAVALVSCSKDNTGTVYTPAGQEASFLFGSFTLSAPSSDPVISVPIYRGNSKGAGTVSITGTCEVDGVVIPASVSFADGSNESTVDINLGSELAVGEIANITLAIAATDASVGGTATATVKASKEYTWTSIGTGTYTDNFICGVRSHECEYQKADGFDRWRAIDPYKECYTDDDGEWEDWIAFSTRPQYVEFWENSDGSVEFATFDTGILYDGAKGGNIYGAYYADVDPEIGGDHSAKLADGVYQLSPFYFIAAIGDGWDMTQEDAVIVIELP